MNDNDDDRALFRPLDIEGGGAGPAGPGPGEDPASGAHRQSGSPVFRAVVLPGPYGRGPWDHQLLHGGPVGGLAGWAAEQLVDPAEPLMCARLTVELLSGVPLEPLTVVATVAKPGRRSRVIDVSVTHGDRTVMRATSQWLMPSPGWDTFGQAPPPRPAQVADPAGADFDYPRPGFNCDAAELRFVSGSTEESGPAVVWARLISPVMAGYPLTPLTRVATLADLSAAAGWQHGPDGTSYINPDITLQLVRYPDGAWLAMDARNHRSPFGVGFNEATFHDDRGPFARVLQSLVASPNQLQSAPG